MFHEQGRLYEKHVVSTPTLRFEGGRGGRGSIVLKKLFFQVLLFFPLVVQRCCWFSLFFLEISTFVQKTTFRDEEEGAAEAP